MKSPVRLSALLCLSGLIPTIGCTIGGTIASPTAAVPSPQLPSRTEVVLSTEIPAPTANGLSAAVPSPTPGRITVIDDFEGARTARTVCIDPECTDSSAVKVALTADHASPRQTGFATGL